MSLLHTIVPALSRSNRPAPSGPETRIKPAYRIQEDEQDYEVIVQLPGVSRDGLEITAQNNELTIIGHRDWNPPVGWTAVHRETSRVHFGLTLTHEGEVAADKIKAELKDGLLTLRLPKAEATKPRKIAIT